VALYDIKGLPGNRNGKIAMKLLIEHLRALGVTKLYTSYHLGKGSPEEFYSNLGFNPTGEFYGDEPEVVLLINSN